MIWVGNFKSLQSALQKPRFAAQLQMHTWLRSEIDLISPFVDWLMSLTARSHCVLGKEEFVELALREAVSNAILHGSFRFLADARSVPNGFSKTTRTQLSSSSPERARPCALSRAMISAKYSGATAK